MKTTKKGFTLIELIVVIAIIGVLAAILVPTMLGYVRKSKLSSANTAASSVYKAINSALTELDEEGIDVGGTYLLTYNASTNAWSSTGGVAGGEGGAKAVEMSSEANKTKFTTKVSNFFADIDKIKQGCQAQMSGGACIACAIASDSTYTGTYPAGVITSDNYATYSGKVGGALTAAISQAGYELKNGVYVKKAGTTTKAGK